MKSCCLLFLPVRILKRQLWQRFQKDKSYFYFYFIFKRNKIISLKQKAAADSKM